MITVAKEYFVNWVARESGDENGRAVIFRELSGGCINGTALLFVSFFLSSPCSLSGFPSSVLAVLS